MTWEKEYYKPECICNFFSRCIFMILFLCSCRFKFCVHEVVANLGLAAWRSFVQPEGQRMRCWACLRSPRASQASPPARGSLCRPGRESGPAARAAGEHTRPAARPARGWPSSLPDTAAFPRASCLLLQVSAGRFSLRPRLVCLCCVCCYPASGGTTKRNTPVVLNSSQSENASSSPTFFFRTPYSSAKPSWFSRIRCSRDPGGNKTSIGAVYPPPEAPGLYLSMLATSLLSRSRTSKI